MMTTLNQLKAIVSTYSITLEVRTNTRLFSIRDDRGEGQECFLAAWAEAEWDKASMPVHEEGESS